MRMKSLPTTDRPPFFWQGFLVLIPLLILTGAGFIGLRRDKEQVRHDAVRQAQLLADELADRLERALLTATLENSPGATTIVMDNRGRLIDPLPYSDIAVPSPLPATLLTQPQRNAWAQLTIGGSPPTDPRNTLQTFLKLDPPPRFAAVGRYCTAMILSKQGRMEDASRVMREFLENNSRVVGESGLPLEPMARINLWKWAQTGTNNEGLTDLTAAVDAAVDQPSHQTPYLLGKISQIVRAMATESMTQHFNLKLDQWHQQEVARQIYRNATNDFLHWPRSVSNPMALNSNPTAQVDLPLCVWVDLRWEPPATPIATIDIGGTKGQTINSKQLSSSTQAYYPPESRRTNSPDELASPSIPGRLFSSTSGGVGTLTAKSGTHSWLLIRGKTNTATVIYHALPILESFDVSLPASTLSNVTQPVRDVLNDMQARLPEHLGISLQLGERPIVVRRFALVRHESGKGGGAQWLEQIPSSAMEELANSKKFADGSEYLRASVLLASPDLLYAQQKDRAVWNGLLIAIAALVAILGVASSRRAFQKQHRLAQLQSNFLASVSHELRAPIASVRLMAEGLEQNRVKEPESRREYFHFIVQECRRLSGLIENILNISRIEQGKQQYEFEPTDIQKLIEDTLQLMRPAAKERRVRLTVHFPSQVLNSPELDGPSIQQALINLIDNAIKHSPDNETVSIWLESSNNDAPADDKPGTSPNDPSRRNTMRLIVADRGPGIPAEDRDRIFERFYRRGSELRRQTQGVGIGLHIVKRTVDAHGGRVWVECSEDIGSRFIMELPICQANQTKPVKSI